MGSVRHLYTTGDNDPEIEPQQYDRHYLYCDACGSFKLTPWAGHGERERNQRIKKIRFGLAVAALIATLFVLVSLAAVLGFVLSPAVLLAPWSMLIGGALLAVGSLVARAVLASGPDDLGLRCEKCDATYTYGTPFFTDLDANPRNLTVADVPRPLGSSTFVRGRSVP